MEIRVVSWKEADEDLVQMIVDDAVREYTREAENGSLQNGRCLCSDCFPMMRADIELGTRRAVMILKGAFQAAEEDIRNGVTNEMEN